MERTIAMSSTQAATCGNSSLTSAPDWPCLLNLYGDARILLLMLNTVAGVSNGIGCPFSLSSRGFGSKVSICEGPPSMNRKIADLAFGAKWGDFGARGFV